MNEWREEHKKNESHEYICIQLLMGGASGLEAGLCVSAAKKSFPRRLPLFYLVKMLD